MKRVTFFHWSKENGPSIVRSFRPLIDELAKVLEVREFYVPYNGANPINLIKNILFVYKHRDKNGINHITGDIHYCILGLINCKRVLTIHDDYAIITAKYGFFDKLYRWLLWFYLPIIFSHRVLCISQSTKKKIDKLYKNEKTEILTHNCVNDGFSFRSKDFNSKCPRILQIGTSHQKNLESTIRAVSNIACELRVIKKMTDEQHKLAKSLNINYSNVFNISDEQVIIEYEKADIVVFPSLFEGFGMPIIEAQAIGRPVITSNIEPMSWVAGNGAELLDDPQDYILYEEKILRLIHAENHRQAIVNSGLVNCDRFRVKTIFSNYLQLYKELSI